MKRTLVAAAVVTLIVPTGVVRANAPTGRYGLVSNTVVVDNRTQLNWQRTPPASSYTWGSAATTGTAQNYCATLSLNGPGWRLPTVKELLTLIDYSQPQGNMMDSVFSSGPSSIFWSVTPVAASPGNAWVTSSRYGSTVGAASANTYAVRCVR